MLDVSLRLFVPLVSLNQLKMQVVCFLNDIIQQKYTIFLGTFQ